MRGVNDGDSHRILGGLRHPCGVNNLRDGFKATVVDKQRSTDPRDRQRKAREWSRRTHFAGDV